MFDSKKNLEILRKAFDVIALEEAKALPTYDECEHITFSAEFEQKMQRLINREKKPYYYLINTVGKRVACIILAALIALTGITFSVKAIREAVIDFFVETFEKFSIVGFKDEDIPSQLDYIETYYAPTYIPDGYKLKTDEKLKTNRRMKYVYNNNYISFKQNRISIDDMYIDTETCYYEEVKILGQEAFFIIKDDNIVLYWNDLNYSYSIQSHGVLAKNDIIQMAESLKAQ